MAKSVADAVLDAALNHVKNNTSRMCICSSEPTTYSQAITTYKLADVSITSTNFGSPANGDGSTGRKIQVNAQSSVSVDSSGSAQHVALVSVTSTALIYVTTCSTQGLTASSTVNVPAWDIQINDPT